MASKGSQVENREGARRQHRVIGLFAVIQCWKRNLDGVVIDHSDFLRLTGLKKVRSERVNWIIEDLTPLFAWVKPRYLNRQLIGKLWLSRLPLEDKFVKFDGYASLRVFPGAPKIKSFELWDDINLASWKKHESLEPFWSGGQSANIDERLLSSYLTLLAQGQISVDSVPSLKDKKLFMIGG